MTATLSMWVIYERPRDFPDDFVVRRLDVSAGEVHHDNLAFRFPTLEMARRAIPPGLVNIGRHPTDDPVIKEVWL